MTTFFVSVGIGLSTAAILSLSAVAFTLQYAVSRVANFATPVRHCSTRMSQQPP